VSIRIVKVLLSLSVAIWGFAAGFMNLVSYESGVKSVAYVLSIEGKESVRAISLPLIYHLGFAVIYLGKFATGFFCALGALDLWKSRHANVESFNAAKANTILGCGIGLFFLFFAFFAVAGAVFSPGEGPPSQLAIGFQSFALYYMGAIGLIALYISSAEPG